MTATPALLVSAAASTLNDPSHGYWSSAELYSYLSEAQSAAVLVRPEANPVRTVLALAAGTLQELPADAYMLIDVVRNMGADGSTPGRAVTPVDRAAMDQTDPDWHTAAASAETDNYVYDIRHRNYFYVSPPQPASGRGRLECVVSMHPAAVSSSSAAFSVEPIYGPALLNYVLFRALMKDMAKLGGRQAQAMDHYRVFMAMMTGTMERTEADATVRHEATEANRDG